MSDPTPSPGKPTFQLDGRDIPFEPGQTVMQAAHAAGVYVPHLCHHPDFTPIGSCKVCSVKINGRHAASCTWPASAGLVVESETPELNAERKRLVQMLFVEGNHHCPFCEKSGDCHLQALGYHFGMQDMHFVQVYPQHTVDASHPDVLLDRSRCVLCELCVRASRDVDGKGVFAMAGRGLKTELIINSPSGQLKDSAIAATDRAMSVCPVGALMVKRVGFRIPIGQRAFDQADIGQQPHET
jgi:[NiFe] hydrogenase diaphorase moiety small subunit